jgi:Mn-dependent DtxR family transcriptional regulator
MDKQILAVLDQHEPLSVVEIADIMGAHPVAVDRHCYQLHQNGYVRVISGGIYSLTEDGEQSLTYP